MQGTHKIQDQVFHFAQPIVAEKGMELVSVEFVKEGANWYLRLYIDKEGGVELDDCQAVSRVISDYLDKKDPIQQSYFLEVSSPGIERLLQREQDFQKYQGVTVNVHTFAPLDGKKLFTGRLGPVQEATLSLYLEDNKEIQIAREKISQVRLAWQD